MRGLLGIPLMMAALVMTSFAVAPVSLPVVNDPAFVAKIQAVIADKNYAEFAIEKFDETKNKSSLTIISGDQAELFIFDYEQQAVYDVKYSQSTGLASSCSIYSMNKAESDPSLHIKDNFHFFGGWRKSSSKTIPHMFSTKNIFSLNNKSPIVYDGPKTIDGIPADRWSTKMYWSDDGDSFNVYYYFTPVSWSSPESEERNKVFPLRIEINGTKTVAKSKTHIHHYYEYLDFATSKQLPADAFDIPKGTYCAVIGKVHMKALPEIPDTITYSREVVDSNGNVNFADVVYDKKMGVMKVMSSQTEVLYDFNTGVRYEIKNGKCSLRAIDREKDSNSKEVGDYVKDLGPAEFQLVNKTLLSMGRGFTRQIDSYIYGGQEDSVQFDIYFGRMDWKYSSKVSNPPLTMDKDGKHYTFFGFKATASTLRTDALWGVCKSYTERETAKIIFHLSEGYFGGDNLLTDTRVAQFADTIAKQSWLQSSQVQILTRGSNYDPHTRRLTLYVRLYSPPDAQYKYKRGINYSVGLPLKYKQRKLSSGDYNSAIKQSASICETTAASTPFLCRNYDLCNNTDGSYTMNMYTSLPKGSIARNMSCNHFARSVDTNAETSLSSGWSNLKDAIKKGFLTTTFKHGFYHLKFTGVSLEKIDWRSIKSDESSPFKKFTLVFFHQPLTNTEVIMAKTHDECATHCLSKGYYHCKGFSMCSESNECVLTADFPQAIEHRNKSSTFSCVTYKRNYVADFKAMPGLVMEYNSNDVYKNVKQTNDCAAKCYENKAYKCESFNYCNDTKECLLSKTHVYSVTANQLKSKTTTCLHFSRNYLLDFNRAAKTGLSSDDKHSLETISVSSPEQCAYLCHTGYSGKGCVQFDYCSDTNQCQIANGKLESYVALVGKAHCDTFTIKDVKKFVASGKLTSSKGTTYSNASFGGLAFAMIVVGLALGAGILFILHRKRVLSRFIG